jgi:hypothetical protein
MEAARVASREAARVVASREAARAVASREAVAMAVLVVTEQTQEAPHVVFVSSSQVVMSALVAVLVTFDGESNWFEGAALIALYIAIATAFWWG